MMSIKKLTKEPKSDEHNKARPKIILHVKCCYIRDQYIDAVRESTTWTTLRWLLLWVIPIFMPTTCLFLGLWGRWRRRRRNRFMVATICFRVFHSGYKDSNFEDNWWIYTLHDKEGNQKILNKVIIIWEMTSSLCLSQTFTLGIVVGISSHWRCKGGGEEALTHTKKSSLSFLVWYLLQGNGSW